MNIKTKLFREARLMFMAPGDAPKKSFGDRVLDNLGEVARSVSDAIDGRDVPVAQAPEAAPKAVEAKRKSGVELIKLAAGMDLDKLKAKAPNFDAIVSAVGLDGKEMKGVMSGSADFDKIGDAIKPQIEGFLKDRDFAALKELLDDVPGFKEVAEADVKEILAVVYKNSAVVAVKKAFGAKYPKFKEYLDSGAKFDNIEYTVSVAGFSQFEAGFKFKPEDFEQAYKEFESKQKPVEEKPEQSEADLAVAGRAAAIEKSWAGRLMVHMGLVKKGGFADVVNGSNSIAAFLVGLLGGKALLGNGVYEGMTKDIPAKHKGMFTALEKTAGGSFLSLSKAKPGEVVENVTDAPVPVKDFGEIVAGKREISEKGIVLSNDYKVPDVKTLQVDLSAGEIVIAKGTSLLVDGSNESAINEDKTLKDKSVKLTGTFTKGLVVKGKPKFELV